MMKTDRLIMHNIRHICSLPITEQYFWEQIQKRDWMVRGHFHRGKLSQEGLDILPIYSTHTAAHIA